jgi:Rrf2 family protein
VISITSKSPYALRALAELGRTGGGGPIPIGELARRRDIPQQFLEGLFATLRRAGILKSQRGVKGGYLFARSPSEVTVLEVVELLEGELSARDGGGDEIWQKAVAALREVLASTTIAELAEREARAKGQSMYYI